MDGKRGASCLRTTGAWQPEISGTITCPIRLPCPIYFLGLHFPAICLPGPIAQSTFSASTSQTIPPVSIRSQLAPAKCFTCQLHAPSRMDPLTLHGPPPHRSLGPQLTPFSFRSLILGKYRARCQSRGAHRGQTSTRSIPLSRD